MGLTLRPSVAITVYLSLNIPQVLLGLTDEDLELGLGVSSLMHRRKLRLAIEDYREAENGRG